MKLLPTIMLKRHYTPYTARLFQLPMFISYFGCLGVLLQICLQIYLKVNIHVSNAKYILRMSFLWYQHFAYQWKYVLLILPWKAIFPTSFICKMLQPKNSAEKIPVVFLGRVTLTRNPQNALHSCCQRLKKKAPASDRKKCYIIIYMRVSIRRC